jgi:hypothetical protein
LGSISPSRRSPSTCHDVTALALRAGRLSCAITPPIAGVDLFVVPTIGFKLLYGLVILGLERRRLVWTNVTANPTAEWQLPGYEPDVQKNRGQARQIMERLGYSADKKLKIKVSLSSQSAIP